MKVLICEDDSDISDLLEIILNQQGHTADKYKNLPTVDEIAVSQPDLIIFDYWINGEKADAIINLIHQDKKLAKIPIILISAIDQLAKVAAHLKVDKVIKKPFDITVVQDAVQEFSNDYTALPKAA